MTEKEIDYEKLGFKAGLEIHQQLDTNRKLFCDCPPVLRSDEPDQSVFRKLHAVAGESGEVDVAAAYQASLDKGIFYQGYSDTNCEIEYDDAPPKNVDLMALKICLQVAILLNAKIFPLTQIMRKTVIDGSNTSGFQRTVLIARDGFVETAYGKVGIESVCLEEDSARIVSSEKGKAVYRLDRLGIPLIEIATAPEIKNPEQAKEVALHIGDVLRSCKVKRGLGTIRQDVNVSIKKGNRIEIKGVQDPDLITKTINSEVKRQADLVKKGKRVESEVRKALLNGGTEFLRPMPGAARMYPETDLPLLKIHRDLINEVKRNLPKLRTEIQDDLNKTGLNQEMIKLLFKENKVAEFKDLLKVINNPQIIVKTLFIFPKEIASKEKISVEKINKILSEDILMFVLEALSRKKISESQVKHVLERIVNGENVENSIIFKKEDSGAMDEKILKIIKGKPGLSINAYMGLVMKEFKGKISGKEAIETIKRYVK